MTQFYAQPYTSDATGFYFTSMVEYDAQYATCKNSFGEQVEEFELQFIDGDDIDAELFRALSIHQGTIRHFIEKIDTWEYWEKCFLIIAVGECGYGFDISKDDPSDFDIDLYEVRNMEELARQFVEDGVFGEIPDHLQHYLDYYAIACDLAMDYTETRIAGDTIIYRCA